MLQLRADPAALAPERLLVVPSEAALRNIVTLWRGWQNTGTLPPRFSAWKTMLSQLRDIRPWGPQDRVTPEDLDVLSEELARGAPAARVEVELVFRRDGNVIEADARAGILAAGGALVSRSRIAGAGYHALLADIPSAVLQAVVARSPVGLAGHESILQIRPQSIFQITPSEEVAGLPDDGAPALAGDPIAAIFDAVPLSAHPRLAGTLNIDDLFGLDGLAVGARKHGTAMASAVIHGDINGAWDRPLERRVHFVNMLYATADANQPERFPDLLPADMFERAILNHEDSNHAALGSPARYRPYPTLTSRPSSHIRAR